MATKGTLSLRNTSGAGTAALQPVSVLRGVGPQLAAKLEQFGLKTLQDLLFHLPLRYIDRTKISPIGGLQPNMEVVIEGEVRAADIVFGRRRSLVCRLQDSTGVVTLRFFHFNRAQQQQLTAGVKLRCYGEVRRGSAGLELYHPEYQLLTSTAPAPLEQRLTPIYPASEGITQLRLRDLCQQALQRLTQQDHPGRGLADLLPATLLPAASSRYSLLQALELLHRPPATTDQGLLSSGEHPAQQRLVIEELVAQQLSMLQLRARVQSYAAPPLAAQPQLCQQFNDQLPFALTAAQQRVVAEIAADLAAAKPMLRLLQGDVGSGKTVVAALAALQAIGNGYQVALMAPTEILAEQHRDTLSSWLTPLGIRIGWLSGKQKGKARQLQMASVADGTAQLVVGTHALFQEEVVFAKLGLTIIDEQHRFGVEQRLTLRRKGYAGSVPHQLIMTATPIPRTLAMSAYADLDCSVIDQLPPGRTAVETLALAELRRSDVMQRVRAACHDGRQAYWVCTLIEESETLAAQAAEATAAELQLQLPELTIGLVHGRLKPSEKSEIMAQFKAGEIGLLVATTVIEVGVDVPNASLMIIENAERLGLSQLHQLRGRVGRGSAVSHCVLLYAPPLGRIAAERLRTMRATNDGFAIAEKDLQLRGPGELLGTRQTGELQLRIADLQRDGHLLPEARRAAEQLREQAPQLVEPLLARWIGDRHRYADA